jgi:hypothetical protein
VEDSCHDSSSNSQIILPHRKHNYRYKLMGGGFKEKWMKKIAAGTQDTLLTKNVLADVAVVEEISVGNENSLNNLPANVNHVDEVHTDVAYMYMVPEVVHGEVIKDQTKDNPHGGPAYNPVEVQEPPSKQSLHCSQYSFMQTAQT